MYEALTSLVPVSDEEDSIVRKKLFKFGKKSSKIDNKGALSM